MLSLHELQSAFSQALLSDDGSAIEPHIVANGIEAAARVRIYRNNTRATFTDTLRAAYPVLVQLVGDDYFRQLALEYRAAHPSRSGNLHRLGEALPEFLVRRFEDGEYAYFADVARLEWAYQEVLVAAEHEALAIERLQGVDPARYGELVFHLHPAARLVSSTFPILTIWSAHQSAADSNRTIDLRSGAEHVLVLRTEQDVELRRLDAAQFAFLDEISRGAPFADAVTRASTAGEFDAGEALRRHVIAHAIVDFHLPHGEPT